MTHPDPDPAESAVRSASRAEDAAYRATNDLGDQLEVDDYRLIGGQMVTLLVHAHRVDAPARATADADAGVRVQVAADPSFLPRFEQLGYRKQSGNRLVRDDDVIDVLVPAATSRARSNRRHGDLVVDETRGLSFALARLPAPLRVAAELTDGSALAFTVSMPDPLAALVLKTFAWTAR